MDNFWNEFKAAIENGNGYAVAACLSPEPPMNDPGRLYSFSRSLNASTANNDLRYALVYSNKIKLSKAEANAWIEVFAAYWQAINSLLEAEELQNLGRIDDARWDRVYEAWKEVVNQLIRAFTSGAFPAWQIPSLYLAGKFLRIFAIRADEHARVLHGDVALSVGYQDDIVGAQKKNEHLEDAARQINRIFTCCVSDR